MIYSYRARDPLGREVTGEMEAASEAELIEQLRGRALTPVRYHVIGESSRGGGFTFRRPELRSPVPPPPADEEPVGEFSSRGFPEEKPVFGHPGEERFDSPADHEDEKPRAGLWTWLLVLYVIYQIISAFLGS